MTKLYPQERKEKIMACLEQAGRLSVSDLSRQLGVSENTIRADLDILAGESLLIRTHGGAIAADRSDVELAFDVRRRIRASEKKRIGAAAAAMVGDGEAIVLDASTTALAMAEQIVGRRELTVLTNGIYTALSLLFVPGATLLMPGGFLRQDSVSLVGHEGHTFVEEFNFQKAFFGAKGFTLEEGLTDVSYLEVTIKRSLLAQARQVIAVVDSSKWGRVGFATYATLDQVHCIITDQGAPADMVAAVRDAGVEVVIA